MICSQVHYDVHTHRSSFSDFAFKYSKDERFKSVEKMREREQLFTDYLAELKKVSKHKEEQKSSKSKEDMVNHVKFNKESLTYTAWPC